MFQPIIFIKLLQASVKLKKCQGESRITKNPESVGALLENI